MYREIKLFGLTLVLLGLVSAQVEIVPVRTDIPPVLDGRLDDEVWQQATGYSGFKTLQPDWGKAPSEQTTVFVAYDDEHLYFAFEARDSEPEKIKAAVTKWDNLFQDDWVSVGLDALNDQQSAYGFIANAYGSQGDITLDSDGDPDAAEDFIWDAAGTLNDSGYGVEMKIPLQSIRYDAGREVVMGLFFTRQLSRHSEMSIFPPIYPDKGSLLTQAGKVVFRNLKYHRTFEILPSFTQAAVNDTSLGRVKRLKEESGPDAGITAKVGLTPTLTMDLTVNPDFSQIESDASQVDVNLRYEIDYPEKRPFFLEGIENFNMAGTGHASAISRAVRTRTITNPSFGLKLSGKVGRANALAALIARDESPIFPDEAPFDTLEIATADVGILRYKRLIKEDTYIGGIFTSREYAGGYNRVVGLDGFWRLSGTTFIRGNAFYGLTKEPDSSLVTPARNFDLSWRYGDRTYHFSAGIHDIDTTFQLHTGYITRDGTTSFNLSGGRTFYLESKLLQKIQAGCWGYVQRDKYYDMNDHHLSVHLDFGMPRSTWLKLNYESGTEVFMGERFDRGEVGIELSSQLFRSFFVALETGIEESPWYEDPEDTTFQGNVASQAAFLNFQPTENFSSELTLVRETFVSRKEGWECYDYRIFRNKTTYQLNKYLFVRGILDYTYVQYPDWGTLYGQDDVPTEKGLTTEFLAGFTPFPGTVIYLGYGSRHENLIWDETQEEYRRRGSFNPVRQGLFFKASYNWRL